MRPLRASRLWGILLAGLWLAGVGVGMWLLGAYANLPGETGAAAVRWPSESSLALAADRPTLVLFAHPRCPCTRASLDELARIRTRCPDRLCVRVLFLKPRAFAGEWGPTDLWHRAAALSGVSVAWDEGGVEAQRFGATTSGLAVLYGPDGRLLFRGGLTAARGHAGDNAGRDAVIALVHGEPARTTVAPVFGCPLFDEPSAIEGECTSCKP